MDDVQSTNAEPHATYVKRPIISASDADLGRMNAWQTASHLVCVMGSTSLTDKGRWRTEGVGF